MHQTQWRKKEKEKRDGQKLRHDWQWVPPYSVIYGNAIELWVMETELWKQSYRAAKQILSYESHHFWIMSYENRELNYGNKPSKQPLNFSEPI